MPAKNEEPKITEEQYRAAAKRIHEDEGTLEIDEDAEVSISTDGGAYVQAWVWVDDSAVAVDPHDIPPCERG